MACVQTSSSTAVARAVGAVGAAGRNSSLRERGPAVGVGVERLAGVQCVRGDAQVTECAVAMTGRRLVRSSALVAPAAQD